MQLFKHRNPLGTVLPPHDQSSDHGMRGSHGDLRRHRFTLTSAKPSKGLFDVREADTIPDSLAMTEEI